MFKLVKSFMTLIGFVVLLVIGYLILARKGIAPGYRCTSTMGPGGLVNSCEFVKNVQSTN